MTETTFLIIGFQFRISKKKIEFKESIDKNGDFMADIYS